MDIDTEDLKIKGVLKFRQMSPLKYNIMGPFVCMPFMECRHQVWSMRHLVSGKISVNKKEYLFQMIWDIGREMKGILFLINMCGHSVFLKKVPLC